MRLNKTITYIIFTVLLMSFVSATSLSRTFSPEVISPGESFTVTYTATSSDAEWFVGFGDTVSCGDDVESFLLGEGNEPTAVKTKVFTAPSSGTCTFTNGYYEFTKGDLKQLPDITLSNGDPYVDNPDNDEKDGFGGGLIWIVVIVGVVLLVVLNKK